MSLVNLLPDDYYQRRRQRRANTLCLALFAVVMVGVMAAVFVSERRVRRAEQVAERVDRQYHRAAERIEQMQRLESEKQRLQQKARSTASLVERLPRSTLLALITNWLPADASLQHFELETEEVRPKRPASGGKSRRSKFSRMTGQGRQQHRGEAVTLCITGLAPTDVDVGQFMARLNASEVIRSARFIYSQEKVIDEVPLREFQIEAILNGDVDATDVLRRDSASARTGVHGGKGGRT